MNRERRSRIRGLIKAFKDLSSTIQNDLSSQVQDLHDLEEEAFDNMPESMQDSDRGTAMQDAMDELQSAVDLCSEPPMPLIPSWILYRPLQNDFPSPSGSLPCSASRPPIHPAPKTLGN